MSARELITEHLNLWTGAVTKKSSSGRGSNGKVELTGIKKLRELILELAVRGLLTEQRIGESDASEIVANLYKEQNQLVAAGLIKKPKPLKPLNEGEKPYPLPKGWQWVRLGQTMEMYNGRAFKSSEWSTSGLPIVRIQNLNDPKAPTNYFSGPLDDRHSIDTGTFLISWSGTPGTSFGAFIWTRGPAALNQHINKCVFFGDILNPEFMQLAVNGQMKNFIQSAQGGVGLKHVTKGVLANALIALPPEEEQHRIVQKVDELMALCDRLEQQTSDQLEAHETLVDTLLGTLTQSENATELADNWARLAVHFDNLFTTEQSIDKLKQTILQLAVMGRLVEQDKGAAESQPKQPLQVSKTYELPQLPHNWQWLELKDIADVVRGGSPRPAGDPRFYGGPIPFLKVGDITRLKGKFVTHHTYSIKEEGLRKTRYIKDRTVLLSNSGATLGIPAICDFPTAFNDGIAAFINLSNNVFDEFLYLFLKTKSHWFLEFASRGQGQPNLNTDIIKSTAIPLPPKPEQRRIVQKVDELMALCDQLKERLNQASETRCQLAEAVAEGALN